QAVEIGKPQRIACGRHAGAVLDGAFIGALARGEDAAAEIGDRADLKLAQIVGRRRKREMDGAELRHRPYSAASAARRSHSTVSPRIKSVNHMGSVRN